MKLHTLAAAALLLAGAARADDESFAREAAQGGLMEVEFGQLLKDKAQTREFRDFGETLIEDHGRANTRLAEIARAQGWTIPTELSPEQRVELAELRLLEGDEFERAARNLAIRDHREDTQKFRDAVETVENADLRLFAQETLPVLMRHLSEAEGLPVSDGSPDPDEMETVP